jgi:hypothetical protein
VLSLSSSRGTLRWPDERYFAHWSRRSSFTHGGSKIGSKAVDLNGTQQDALGLSVPETWDTGTQWDTTERVAAIL